MKNILAIDIGTHTGIVYNDGSLFTCETWDLATTKEIKAQAKERMNRRNDIRVYRLFTRLADLHVEHPLDIVIFEDVIFSTYTYQTQLWSSLRAAIWLVFPPSSGVKLECVPVATLKKFSTGHGNATKGMMSAALQALHPDKWSPKLDDNSIDAIWLYLWAKENLIRSNIKKDTTAVIEKSYLGGSNCILD